MGMAESQGEGQRQGHSEGGHSRKAARSDTGAGRKPGFRGDLSSLGFGHPVPAARPSDPVLGTLAFISVTLLWKVVLRDLTRVWSWDLLKVT